MDLHIRYTLARALAGQVGFINLRLYYDAQGIREVGRRGTNDYTGEVGSGIKPGASPRSSPVQFWRPTAGEGACLVPGGGEWRR
ncbi:hypothetical protein MRX96_037692 [Rhipicephalus microplus]